MGTISDCWHLKVNLKEKMYLFVKSTTQRCQKNNWAANISENFFKNLEMTLT
jgi:hypothetical protein